MKVLWVKHLWNVVWNLNRRRRIANSSFCLCLKTWVRYLRSFMNQIFLNMVLTFKCKQSLQCCQRLTLTMTCHQRCVSGCKLKQQCSQGDGLLFASFMLRRSLRVFDLNAACANTLFVFPMRTDVFWVWNTKKKHIKQVLEHLYASCAWIECMPCTRWGRDCRLWTWVGQWAS